MPALEVYSDESDEEVTANMSKKQLQELERKKMKNKKKKMSKKKTKAAAGDSGIESQSDREGKMKGAAAEKTREGEGEGDDVVVEIEYVGEKPTIDESDKNFAYFAKVFDAFKIEPEDEAAFPVETEKKEIKKEEKETKASMSERILQEEMMERKKDEEAVDLSKMSRRKLRLALQPSIAKLKESINRSDVVEWADVTSRDPFLLVALKSYRNTIPVPRHWNAKRKYLAGKRGFERQPFQLPDFIRRTGIMEMRETLWEKEENQSLKAKMRERARPKLGKIDIDYQKLHDAFFKWQSKPYMSKMGELYYEGKEQEAMMRDKKPGELSDELRIALGMPVGVNAYKFPPPWLIAMQRYGPPPSYPQLKISGLNAPIPDGCAFGYHAGGWGKPPVDDYGQPLYGDVFGLNTSAPEPEDETRIERRFWGEIGSDEESEESEEEEEEEDETQQLPQDGMTTPMAADGLITPSGITTGVTGLETPDSIELRKGKRTEESSMGMDTPAPPQAAYHIIPEKKSDRVANQMMASTHVYDLSKKQGMREDGVEVSLDPEALDLDEAGLQEKYEEQLRKQRRGAEDEHEDLTDMVAEHAAKQNRKRKAQEQKKQSQASTDTKKHKNFKF